MLMAIDQHDLRMEYELIVMKELVHYPIEILFHLEIVLLIEVVFDKHFVEHFDWRCYLKEEFSMKIEVLVC
jgi:hypothetical protein